MTKDPSNDAAARYADIIGLAHHQSATRPHMTMAERAAQFSPFAALTGYGAALDETARVTSERAELAEDERAALDARLALLSASIAQLPEARLTYFVPDERKSGGEYVTRNVTVRRIDAISRCIITTSGDRIPLERIRAIEGALFDGADQ